MSNLHTKQGSQKFNYRKAVRSNELIPVRVVDIILDDQHPEYVKYGQSECIGAIKYTYLDRKQNTTDPKVLNIAYPVSSTIRTLPLKNEIVFKILAPDSFVIDTKGSSTKEYYTTIVSLWNHPTDGKAPSQLTPGEPNDRYGFPDISDVNPLQPFPGDVLVEGRLGQSIRLGGSKFQVPNSSISNPITDSSNNGKPFIIISNGQKDVGDGAQHIIEDINDDASSIYFLSDHKVPLTQSKSKYAAIRNKPTLANDYKGSQVVINSGRLYFNSKDENILLTSKNDIHFSSLNIGLDAEKEIGLDGEKIYLGATAFFEREPVIKGDQLELFLEGVLNIIDQIGNSMSRSNLSVGGKDLSSVLNAPAILKSNSELRELIRPGSKQSFLKSTKVYVE